MKDNHVHRGALLLKIPSATVRERERERGREREREIERDFYFLKVHLGDSNRQPQSSRENLE